MRFFPWAASLVLLLPATGLAIPWSTDWNASLLRARSEKKLLAVFSTSPTCEPCAIFEKRLSTPGAAASLGAFVPVRLEAGSPLPNGSKAPAVGLWIFDPEANVVTALGLPSPSLMESHLSFYREAALPLLEGIELVEKGEIYEGRMAKARGLRALAAVGAATRELEAARQAARDAGRTREVHLATIEMAELLGESDVKKGHPPRDAEDLLYRTFRDVPDPVVRSEALGSLIRLHRYGGAVAKELETLGRALEESPAGSEIERTVLDLAGLESPPASVVLLLPPPPLLGPTPVSVAARDRRIQRVELRVDGKTVGRDAKQPFSSTIDLGSTPTRRSIEVRAFDTGGNQIARHVRQVNLPETFFEIELLPVRVEADEMIIEAVATAGPGRRVGRIDFHLNGDFHSSVVRPPYRIRIPRQGYGFVRASATDSAGVTKEDILFFDPETVDDTFQLNLVEVLVNVEDAAGRPILDLTPEEFRISESRERRAVRSARQLSTDPRMAAIAVDRSKSLHGIMKDVGSSAVRFAEKAVQGGEVFIVGFHHRPEILQWTTSRSEAVRASIEDVEASGNTALHEALIFSLMQFQNSSGNRFLLVLTDGIDTASRYDQKQVTRIANQFGVPIYFVFIDSYDLRAMEDRVSALGEIAEQTGGRAFRLQSLDQLEEIWRRIQLDVDSRYLVTYHTSLDPSRWRPIEVQTTRSGGRVRSIRGLTPSLSQ